MSGGVSTAADALQEKHILAANVLYILLLPLRLILRMLLSQAKLTAAGIRPIVIGDFRTVFAQNGVLGNFTGMVDYVLTDPPWGVFQDSPHDKVPSTHYDNVAEGNFANP